MNHHCECGHLPKDHHMDFGACEADEETLWGVENCKCPHYEKDSDE